MAVFSNRHFFGKQSGAAYICKKDRDLHFHAAEVALCKLFTQIAHVRIQLRRFDIQQTPREKTANSFKGNVTDLTTWIGWKPTEKWAQSWMLKPRMGISVDRPPCRQVSTPGFGGDFIVLVLFVGFVIWPSAGVESPALRLSFNCNYCMTTE